MSMGMGCRHDSSAKNAFRMYEKGMHILKSISGNRKNATKNNLVTKLCIQADGLVSDDSSIFTSCLALVDDASAKY